MSCNWPSRSQNPGIKSTFRGIWLQMHSPWQAPSWRMYQICRMLDEWRYGSLVAST